MWSGWVSAILIWLQLSFTETQPNIPEREKDRGYWNSLAKDYISRRLKWWENNNIARNVILFVGDGMGPSTVTAGRILRGQKNGRPGEETVLSFEDFPNIALSKTYNVDRQTSDSSATATAFLSGVKTNFYTVGLDAHAEYDDCQSSVGNEVTTMLDWSEQAGKATGIVTTARITHATPASAYAHSPNRYWESDVDGNDVTVCKDIARQLVEDNPDIEVLFGGGRRNFLPPDVIDPETNTTDSNKRQDGRNLIREWEKSKQGRGIYQYVWNKEQFDKLNTEQTEFVLGLFEPSHMQYEIDRDNSSKGEPSLAEMTRMAIQLLSKHEDGFFLLVEGARIDQAHHDNKAVKAIHEVLTFDDAVRTALEMTSEEDTLIIVTADHSSSFDITGYPYRGSDIFNIVEPVHELDEPMDKLPYSTLIYTSGPGHTSPRQRLDNRMLHDKEFAYPGAVPAPWTFHSGEDVAIYAQGPMAHLFHGVHEQNYIGHVMAYAACIGPYHNDCSRGDYSQCTSTGSSHELSSLFINLCLFLLLVM